MDYRHELKHIVNNHHFDILKGRIGSIMQLDSHLKDGTYNIRSVYFDDYYDRYMEENESGINDRSKIRIRIYDHLDKVIKLEIKYKLNGMTKKESCSLTREMCDRLLKGECPRFEECKDNKVLSRLYIEMQTRVLRPKVIVEYDRTPYIYYAGNVRVTFDMNIRASKRFDLFFEENIYAVPVLETGMHVLEVKYDEILPDYISQVLELNNLQQTSFSKYYLSRLTMGGL